MDYYNIPGANDFNENQEENDNQDEIYNPNYNEQIGAVGDHENDFFYKLTPKEINSLFVNIFPSLFFIFLILLPFKYSPTYFDTNMYVAMKTFFVIFVLFVLHSLIKSIIVCCNKHEKSTIKNTLNVFNLIFYLSYYICVVISYMIYSGSSELCFRKDTLTVIVFFSLMFTGIISLAQKIIDLILVMICFVLMVNNFRSDPTFFYSHFGVDPEMIKNLPTIPAEKNQTEQCAICLLDVHEGDPILVLGCEGKHYFHGNCIKAWLLSHNTCPLCRSQVIF